MGKKATCVNLNDIEFEHFKEMVKKDDMTVSAMIRRLIREYMKKKDNYGKN